MNAAPVLQAEGTSAPASTRFVDNGDGTITDTTTGLMWSKATLCEEEVDHAAAEALCRDLTLAGHADWRVPTPHELFSLVDHSRYSPAIDVDAFPDTQSDWYWTSSRCAWAPAYAWVVLFYGGNVYSNYRDFNLAFVRAVRSAAVPAGQ